MKLKWLLIAILVFLISGTFYQASAQTYCPANINFEQGSLSNWTFDTAVNYGYLANVGTSGPLPNRHVLTSGSGTDPYGGFPVVDPQGGSYSLKLGNDDVNKRVDIARYTFTIPSNANNFSIIYRYAVVLEDPVHAAGDQPYFKARVYNTNTGATLSCASFTFVSGSGLNGFSTSSQLGAVGNAVVYYKPWSTASLNLSGQAGTTVTLEFTSADCALGAHMGYGYVDVLCPNFSLNGNSCNPTSTLSAPAGFQNYTWYNANYTSVLGTSQSITVTTPSTLTNYHVVVTPYAGTGCTDTLLAQLSGSPLAVNAGADTMLCNNPSIVLHPTVTGATTGLTYNWAPSTGLSCTNCQNPTASPTANTNYVLTVTDSNGCTKTDTVSVKAKMTVAATATNPLCFGALTATATATATLGTAPYNYSWNTVPAQTTATATGIGAGSYMVTVTDNKGCTATQSVAITQPTKVVASIASADSVSCNGGNNGQATATAAGGTSPYAYTWNTTPTQTTALATGLAAGTYVVTVTDGHNCTDTESVVIKQPAQLNVTISKANVTCHGAGNGTAQATVTGGTAPYLYSWSGASSNSSSVSGLAAGTYTLTVTDQKGCVTTGTVVITQPAALTVVATATSASCNSISATATATAGGGVSPYSYVWNTVPAQTTATATGLTAGTYTVVVTDAAGCTSTTTTTIAQTPSFSATVAATMPGCYNGTNGSATVTPNGGIAPYTYAWNTTPAQTTAAATGLAAGTYTVTVTASNGCIAVQSVTIGQPTQVTASIQSVDSTSCYGGTNGHAVALGTGGTAPYGYSWNTTPGQATAAVSNLPAGTYVVTVTDAHGCIDTESVKVRQPLALSIALAKTNVSCYGGSNGTVQTTVNGGTAPYSYSWTTLGYTTSSINGITAGNYTVIVTDQKGCMSTANTSITQPTALTVTATGTAPTCYNGTNGTAVATVTGGTGPYSYAWNSSTAQNAQTAQQLAAGNYLVVITDNAGCTATATVALPQPAQFTVAVTGTQATCFGKNNGTATAQVTGGTGPYTYSWNTNPVQTGQTATGLVAGTYTVTATNANGCTATGTVTISQPTKLNVTTTATAICPGATQGSAMAVATGGIYPYTYNWNTNPAQHLASATGLAAGTYTVRVTDSNGCKDSATASIGVFQAPHITATADSVICRGSNATLTATGGQSYNWSPANAVACADCATTQAHPDSTKTFTVTGTDSNGCKATAQVTVAVIQHTPVSVEPVREVCAGDTVRLGVTGGTDWTWIPKEAVDDSRAKRPLATPQSTTVYNVIVTENVCFKDTLQQQVTVIPYPTVNLGADKQAATGTEVTLNAEVTDAASISWTPDAVLSCKDCYTPRFTMGGTASSYIATVANKLGCKASDTITISTSCDSRSFFFANLFTPNGDGHNDRFYPQGPANSQIQHFVVYSRWGEVVYSANNIMANDESVGWDGTYKNQTLKPDVYVYVVEATCGDGSKVVTRGDITLVR